MGDVRNSVCRAERACCFLCLHLISPSARRGRRGKGGGDMIRGMNCPLRKTYYLAENESKDRIVLC